MLTLSMTRHYRSVPRLLQALHEDWHADRAARHAETIAYALDDLSRRPGFAARAALPAALDFVERNGAEGVDGILWSALSAASVHDPRGFQRAIDRLILRAGTRPAEEAKPAFRIAFVDFDTLPPTRPAGPASAAGGRDGRYGDVLSDLVAARLGSGQPFLGGDPERLGRRFGAVGAGIILNALHSSHTDRARSLLSDLDALTEARSRMLPGFGFAIRRRASGLDAYEAPGTERAGDWTKSYRKALNTAISVSNTVSQAAGAAAGAGMEAGAPPAVTLTTGLVAGCAFLLAQQLEVIRQTVGEAVSNVEKAMKKLEEATQGNTDDPEDQDEKKMPVPDDDGGGRPTIFEVLQALEAYAARLDPLINPGTEDFGGGVTYARIPQPGNIDPLWEQTGGSTMNERELLAWLGFLQAKLYDSLINPLPE